MNWSELLLENDRKDVLVPAVQEVTEQTVHKKTKLGF